jgi:hypothetical protein
MVKHILQRLKEFMEIERGRMMKREMPALQ